MRRRPFTLLPRDPAESELQIDVARMLERLLLPDVAWTAVAHEHSLNRTLGRNGRPIGLLEMQKRKARGVKAGIWDIWFAHLGRTYWIELKVNDNNLSPDQEDFGRQALRAGCQLKVCWSVLQVVQTLQAWGLVRAAVIAA